MSSVKFKTHLLVDGKLDHTIEDAFTALAAYAGIHSQDFDDEFVEAGATTTQWGTASDVSDGTWTTTGGRIRGVGDGSADWQFCMTTVEMPKAFVLNFDAFGDDGCIGFMGTDQDNLIYFAWSATQIAARQRSSGSDTDLCILPKAMAGNKSVTVSVQPGDGDDMFFSMWFDEVFAANAWVAEGPSGRYIAVGTYSNYTCEYDDMRVAELTEALPICTMDTGEVPLGALQRALGRRHINYFVRFNGKIRAWRPKSQAAVTAFTDPTTYSHGEKVDRIGLVSHWRQIGAWETADAYDEALMAAIGHRFHKDDNPDLMTEDECETEAEQNLVRAKEYAHTVEADHPFYVFLEPEDRVTIDGDDWILTNYSTDLKAGSLALQASLREYAYD